MSNQKKLNTRSPSPKIEEIEELSYKSDLEEDNKDEKKETIIDQKEEENASPQDDLDVLEKLMN